jgi:hypothetical protein
MKKRVLARYDRDADGRVLIDVAADRAEDLYNDFDRSAPYVKRDLDPDLVDYLIHSARELGRVPFALRFTLAQNPGDELRTRLARSMNSFFLYLTDVQRHSVRQLVRRSFLLFTIGIGILFASVWANSRVGPQSSVAVTVFAEGLTVAAWVSLWEAIATFLVDWLPHVGDIALYRRFAGAPIIFRDPSADHDGAATVEGAQSQTVTLRRQTRLTTRADRRSRIP